MKIYTDINDIKIDGYVALTIGTFDGVHNGHKEILKVLLNDAKSNNGESFVVTFFPHPRKVISKNFPIKLLTTREEKIELFRNTGIDNLLIINFTEDFAKLGYDEFVKEYLVDAIKVNKVIIGFDHKFGKDRSGNESKLRELGKQNGFDVEVVDEQTVRSASVSSSIIRDALCNGKIETANELLGSTYKLHGKVVEGAKRGRTLGFPTANIELNNDDKLIPQAGVYFTGIYLGNEKFYGIMNIGYRPTFDDELGIVIEVHILDFNRDIYFEKISVELLYRMRDEKKFSSKEDLIAQITEDKNTAIEKLKLIVN
ncbi:MAG: bifunctional riboflavin kinase/FAD synthetase [Melioribacteraceae bacterium]|nr:bifunctional riboflavin kinase/FAD synthetase [Melioribacteraceae bacterium]MCF8263973.1 bifunctional riboflavin kinase/FAD synthetase [Melioribacteraceae bacterium]MCF8411825.1 bifunctional riboflavin kinase/FAD synthetase [Melioribacteraceae bacterium]MCF8432603.1 bifunctional riboflavin kinase/FAD synthetase [Melioribacteraceae bacterium]